MGRRSILIFFLVYVPAVRSGPCPAKYLPELVQGAVGDVMEHTVAVGADDGKIIECTDRFLLQCVQRLNMVTFAEADASWSIGGGKVETAAFAGQSACMLKYGGFLALHQLATTFDTVMQNESPASFNIRELNHAFTVRPDLFRQVGRVTSELPDLLPLLIADREDSGSLTARDFQIQ